MWFGDLENNGGTDVLLLYHPGVGSTSHSTTLICYSDRGREKWQWTPGRELPELGGSPATFTTVGFGVLKAKDGKNFQIVVSSSHSVFSPHQIAIVDSHGKTVSEYWHSGHLDHLALRNVGGKGREEIVATGISNGYRQATLIVLDPNRVLGASTEAARPDLQLHGMGVAAEKLRVLFPRSDLNRELCVYNVGQEPAIEHGRIRLAVRESCQGSAYSIWYQFDENYRLLSAQADDRFREAHTAFYLTNKPHHAFTKEEESEFQKVRCLAGCEPEFAFSLAH